MSGTVTVCSGFLQLLEIREIRENCSKAFFQEDGKVSGILWHLL